LFPTRLCWATKEIKHQPGGSRRWGSQGTRDVVVTEKANRGSAKREKEKCEQEKARQKGPLPGWRHLVCRGDATVGGDGRVPGPQTRQRAQREDKGRERGGGSRFVAQSNTRRFEKSAIQSGRGVWVARAVQPKNEKRRDSAMGCQERIGTMCQKKSTRGPWGEGMRRLGSYIVMCVCSWGKEHTENRRPDCLKPRSQRGSFFKKTNNEQAVKA